MEIGATSDFRGKIGQEITDICLQINDGIELGRGGHTFDVHQVQKLEPYPELTSIGESPPNYQNPNDRNQTAKNLENEHSS